MSLKRQRDWVPNPPPPPNIAIKDVKCPTCFSAVYQVLYLDMSDGENSVHNIDRYICEVCNIRI